MFLTFRRRLLFWFLVFISFNLIVVALSTAYIQQREKILQTTSLIESTYNVFLKSVLAQQEFLSYDTKNGHFFQTGESQYLKQYENLLDTTIRFAQGVIETESFGSLRFSDRLEPLHGELEQIDSLFRHLVVQVKKRGYKDYNLEGQMRTDAHWLEDIREIPDREILSLRRHEKDYIIRNEQSYVDQFKRRIAAIKKELELKRGILSERKVQIINRLNAYQDKFEQLVQLDRETGIKDNSALKEQLDTRIHGLEMDFNRLVREANQQKQKRFLRLNFYFMGMIVLLFFVSLLLSTLISKRITQPLSDLTEYITKFVNSNFTLEENNPVARSKDEIGKLTQNFTILKEEVINRLKFFKQKVDERTAELAQANERLMRLNEANSRFVPVEFIHYLDRKSIEEVKLGDQTEREMTIMFTDIRSFTKISEALTPQENFDFINNYLKCIVPIIRRYEGLIDKFIGDSIMALFPKGPATALAAALDFDEALAEFNAEQATIGRDPIRIGVGIHTGRMILGTIGHDQRLDTTVISDAVNIASRVEGLTKYYSAKVIATNEVLQKLPPDHSFHYRFLEKVRVKGKSKTISIYEFIVPGDTLKLEYLPQYRTALQLFLHKKLDEAFQALSSLYQINPKDGAIKKLIEKCYEYKHNGFPDEWDGVEYMKEK